MARTSAPVRSTSRRKRSIHAARPRRRGVAAAVVALPESPLRIDLRTENTRVPASLKTFLITHLHRAAAIASVTSGQVDLLLVNDDLMAELHWEHKQVEGTTDILTFDLRENRRSKTHVEVDLILCVDEARRQAMQRGHKLEHELLLYAVHGLLHLIGYDDLRPTAAAKMHREEDRILSALGLGAIYARPAAAGDAATNRRRRTPAGALSR